MSAAARSEVSITEDVAGKRQKKEEVDLDTLDLSPLPDGFKSSITAAEDSLVITQDMRSIEALAVKHHQAVLLFRSKLRDQGTAQAKLEACLRAMEVAVPATARQQAAEAGDLAKLASTAAYSANLGVETLTEQLNKYAEAVGARR